jgi:hypothetical protein
MTVKSVRDVASRSSHEGSASLPPHDPAWKDVRDVLENVRRLKEEERRFLEEIARTKGYYLGYLPVTIKVVVNGYRSCK